LNGEQWMRLGIKASSIRPKAFFYIHELQDLHDIEHGSDVMAGRSVRESRIAALHGEVEILLEFLCC